jgi:beta-glucanase (GH16 family)
VCLFIFMFVKISTPIKMKKLFSILFFLQFIIVSAQTSQGFSYESTIRNSSNQIVPNQYISLRFTIKLGSTTGTTVYSELQNPFSNASGNVSLTIGNGKATTGTFSSINWAAGTHYLVVEFFTGSTCQWINVPVGINGQIVSKCNDIYSWGTCTTPLSLVWSDEFNTTGPVAIDGAKWHHQTQLPNGYSWYSGEEQHYTNRQTNSYQDSGSLKIVAKKEPFIDQGVTKQYTSARLNSKFAFKYGRVEVRAKLPIGVGTWPAIWMLGKNINELGGYWQPTFGTVSWPACGEIDIMEHWGRNQNVISSAIHHPIEGNLFVDTYSVNEQYKPDVSSEFHIYSVDWTAEKVTFSVDGVAHLVYNPAIKNAYSWPFDAEQYILLNVAMQPTIDSNFTQSAMEIDYVRVYQ